MDNMSAVGSPQDLLPDNQHKVGYGAFLDEGKVLCRKRTLKEKHEIPENILFMVVIEIFKEFIPLPVKRVFNIY